MTEPRCCVTSVSDSGLTRVIDTQALETLFQDNQVLLQTSNPFTLACITIQNLVPPFIQDMSSQSPQRFSILIYLLDSWHDICQIATLARQLFRHHYCGLLLVFVLAALSAGAILPWDMIWLHDLQEPHNEALDHLARQLSFWGDWYTGTLILTGCLWLLGLVIRKDMIRRVALGCLMAALLAGLFGDVFRYGLGRARPNSGFAEGLYGPSLSSKLHSFPSGHTTTAFGTAVAAGVIYPPVAIPCLILAGGVAWSRLYLNYHHPSDVLMGGVLGSSFGWIFGVATRRIHRQGAGNGGIKEIEGEAGAFD